MTFSRHPLDRAPVLDEVAFPPLPGSAPQRLAELDRGACRWPVGPAEPFQAFCALHAASGPWCPEHARQGRRGRRKHVTGPALREPSG